MAAVCALLSTSIYREDSTSNNIGHMGLLRPAGSSLAESTNLDFLAAVANYSDAIPLVLHRALAPVPSIYMAQSTDFRYLVRSRSMSGFC